MKLNMQLKIQVKKQRHFINKSNTLKLALIAFTFITLSSQSFAQRQTQPGSTPPPRQGSGVGDNNTGRNSGGGQNIHDNAEEQSDTQKAIAAVNLFIGGALIAEGISQIPSPGAYVRIGMGILGLLQAKDTNDASRDSGRTADLTGSLGNPNFDNLTNPGSNGTTSPGVTPGGLSTLRANLDRLRNAGVNVDLKNNTITTPDGKKFDLKKDFSSAAAMKKAGFADSVIQDAMKKAEQIAKQAQSQVAAHAVAIDEDGGGGGAAAAATTGISDEVNPYHTGQGGTKIGHGLERDPAALSAGMSKDFNGEKIGVAYDSIFLMMNRRYTLKENQGFFFKPNEGFGK